jgi:large subunit ribosomal protein L29
MKARKFDDFSFDELHLHEREISEQLFRLRFQAATGQGEGLRKLRELKKDLARVKTTLRQMELRAARASESSAAADKGAPPAD